MRKTLLLLLLCGLWCVTGCSSNPAPQEDDNGLRLSVAIQPLETCNKTPSIHGTNQFPPDAAKVKIRVKNGDTITREMSFVPGDVLATGELLIEQIPVGDNLTLEVFACNDAGAIIWAGRTGGLKLTEFQKVNPEVFLTRRGGFNCTGSNLTVNNVPIGQAKLPSNLAFHTATPLDDGTILFTGGLATWLEAVSGTATNRAALYHPTRGVFEHLPSTMLSARAFHKAVPFVLNGRKVVLIIGGAAAVSLGNVSSRTPFGVTTAVSVPMEAYDPGSKTFIAVTGVDIPLRMHASVAASADGTKLVVSGGINDANKVSDELYIWSGANLIKTRMRTARVGHSISVLSNGAFLFWGGNLDGKVENFGELLRADSNKTEAAPLGNPSTAPEITAFHSATQINDSVLILGGHRINLNQNKVVAKTAEKLAYLISYDGNTKQVLLTAITLDTTGEALVERVYHSATAVGNKVIVAGGMFGFQETVIDSIAVVTVDGANSSVTALKDRTDQVVTFPHTTMGTRGSLLPDGTVLFTGGITSIKSGANNDVLDIAYLWSNPISDPANCD